jgi:hypothetical protein
VVFKFFVTTDAGKVRHKIETTARFTLERCDWAVLFVGVLACTTGPPCVNIESFSPRQPPLTKLFRSSWYKPEKFTRTRLAV